MPARRPGLRRHRLAAPTLEVVGGFGLLEPLLQPAADLLRRELRPSTLVARHDGPRGGDTGEAGDAEDLPELHGRSTPLNEPAWDDAVLSLEAAVDLTRTGDVWLFRGRSPADHAIRAVTNAPVNHVGMAVVLDDLPPLMWHAELGQGLLDVWTGTHHRGVQLHDLRDAVVQWCDRYEQRAWLRQLETPVTREMEDAVLRTIARLDGTPFPATAALAGRWLRGRLRRHAALETTYCAEVVAFTTWMLSSAHRMRNRSMRPDEWSGPCPS